MLLELMLLDNILSTSSAAEGFRPLLLTHDKAFEEIFCHAMLLFDKKWNIMNAVYIQFPEVLAACKQLMDELLSGQPNNIEEFQEWCSCVIMEG